MTTSENEIGKIEIADQSVKDLYFFDQSPLAILPDVNNSDDPFRDLKSKALERAIKSIGIFSQIGKGEIVELSHSKRHDTWTYSFISSLSNAGILPQKPNYYVKYPSIEPEMGYNPIPYQFVFRAGELKRSSQEQGINLGIIGSKQRLGNGKTQEYYRNSDILVAIPSNIEGVIDLLKVFKDKLEGKNIHKPLIIENSQEIYNSLLANIQLLEYQTNKDDNISYLNFKGLAGKYGIYITENPDETKKLIQELSPKIISKKTAANLEDKPASERPVIRFLATGTRKKYTELSGIISHNKFDMPFLPIDLLLEKYISPKEDRESYEGNAVKKLQAAIDAWGSMSAAQKGERLKYLETFLKQQKLVPRNFKLKESDIKITAEDSGFHFVQTKPGTDESIAGEHEIVEVGGKVNKLAPFPGVETGPATLASYGIYQFLKNVEKLFGRYRAEGHPVTYNVEKVCVIAEMSLAQDISHVSAYLRNPEEQKPTLYSAVTKGKFITKKPKGKDNQALEIDDFLIPEGLTKTERQLGEEWYNEINPKALALKALAIDNEVPLRENSIKKVREKKMKICLVQDNQNDHSTKVIGNLQEQLKKFDTEIATEDSKLTSLSDVQTKFLEGKDAVIIAFDPEKAKIDYFKNLYVFTSLICGEQTRDKYKLEKPFYLVNPKDDNQTGPFDYLENLAYDYNKLGTVPQDPKTLVKPVRSLEDAIDDFEKTSENYIRYIPYGYSKKKEKFDAIGEKQEKDFTVAVFTSATSENVTLNAIAGNFAEKLADKGIGVISGGGLVACMGTVTKTLYNRNGDTYHEAHNVPHIMEKETGGKDVSSYVSQFQLCRDIYERIEGLLKADVSVVTPGGIGTIQELAAFAILKQMHVENPENPYVKDFKNKELIVLNTEIEIDGKKIGFYDQLLKHFPDKETLDKLGIKIVDSQEQAMARIDELRVKKRESLRNQVSQHL